jgi:hypothetical protein
MIDLIPSAPTSTIDLASEDLDDFEEIARLPIPSPSVAERLRAYGILVPAHARLPERVLAGVEQLFATWAVLGRDDERRDALTRLFPGEAHARAVLQAVVPIYHDAAFFDERTPTRSLVEIALVAHSKWRRWLMAS